MLGKVHAVGVPPLIEAKVCDVGMLLGPLKAAVVEENQAIVFIELCPVPIFQLVVTVIGPDATPFGANVIVAGVTAAVIDSPTLKLNVTDTDVLFICVAWAWAGIAMRSNADKNRTASFFVIVLSPLIPESLSELDSRKLFIEQSSSHSKSGRLFC